MRVKIRLLLVGLLAVMVFPIYASATTSPTLVVVGGQLMGADGVHVGGSHYDVRFQDGTCIGLFSGCNDSTDFEFPSAAGALAASEALLAQVYQGGGIYDTTPGLTNGIWTGESSGWIMTPLSSVRVVAGVFEIAYMYAQNGDGVIPDITGNDYIGMEVDTLQPTGIQRVWAVWSAAPTQQVPEPSTLLLLGSGLAGLAFIRRKRKIK